MKNIFHKVSNVSTLFPFRTSRLEHVSHRTNMVLPPTTAQKMCHKFSDLSLESPRLCDMIRMESFGRCSDINATLLVKELINEENFFRGIVESGSEPGKGLVVRLPPLRVAPSSGLSSVRELSSLSEILSVLIPCLCIGCAISWGSMDFSTIIPTTGIDVEALLAKDSFYRLMETVQHFIVKHKCSSTLESQADKIIADTLAEAVEQIKERESQEILRSFADKHCVVSASLFVGTIILAALLTKSLVE